MWIYGVLAEGENGKRKGEVRKCIPTYIGEVLPGRPLARGVVLFRRGCSIFSIYKQS